MAYCTGHKGRKSIDQQQRNKPGHQVITDAKHRHMLCPHAAAIANDQQGMNRPYTQHTTDCTDTHVIEIYVLLLASHDHFLPGGEMSPSWL